MADSTRFFSMHTFLLLATVAFLERGKKDPVFTAEILDALEERGIMLRSRGAKSPGNSLWVRFNTLTKNGLLTRKAFRGPGRGATNYAWRTTSKGRKHVAQWGSLLRTLKVHLVK